MVTNIAEVHFLFVSKKENFPKFSMVLLGFPIYPSSEISKKNIKWVPHN